MDKKIDPYKYLLNLQRKKKESILDGLDWLLLYADFNNAVDSMRNELSIVPDQQRTLFGVDKYDQLENMSAKIRAQLFGPNSMSKELDKLESSKEFEEYLKWQRKQLPELDIKITELRLKTVGKIPYSWHDAIKAYVQLDLGIPIVLSRKHTIPEISEKIDPITHEPYLEIKVYPDIPKSFYADKAFRKLLIDHYGHLPEEFIWTKNLSKSRLFEKFVTLLKMKEAKSGGEFVNKLEDAGIEEPGIIEFKQEFGSRFKKLLFRQ